MVTATKISIEPSISDVRKKLPFQLFQQKKNKNKKQQQYFQRRMKMSYLCHIVNIGVYRWTFLLKYVNWAVYNDWMNAL